MAQDTMTVELVGGPKCGERMPIFGRALDLLAAGKAYTVKVPALETPRAHFLGDEDVALSPSFPCHRYELGFRSRWDDPGTLTPVLWYRGMQP